MLYIFKHPKKDLYVEVQQGMNEEHVYSDSSGVKWERVYTNPQISVNDRIDPFSANDFTRVTGKQRGTYGDVLDRSRELSEKREKIAGVDPVKQKYFEDYSKKRRGKVHPQDPRAKTDFSF
jgi:hypothetical protein